MGTQQDPRITKLGYTMSFHKQIERQLAQEFSPNEATILVDYNDAVYYGRRLQALEMERLPRAILHLLFQELPAPDPR